MPTAVFCADDDDGGIVEMLALSEDQEPWNKTPTPACVSVAATLVPSVFPKGKAAKAAGSNEEISTGKASWIKKRPASSSVTANNHVRTADKSAKKPKTKKVAAGQTTLGSFFGGAVKKTRESFMQPSISAEKRAQLRDICLVRTPSVPAKVSPMDTDRRASSPPNGAKEGKDVAHLTDTTDVTTPLAKDAKTPEMFMSGEKETFAITETKVKASEESAKKARGQGDVDTVPTDTDDREIHLMLDLPSCVLHEAMNADETESKNDKMAAGQQTKDCFAPDNETSTIPRLLDTNAEASKSDASTNQLKQNDEGVPSGMPSNEPADPNPVHAEDGNNVVGKSKVPTEGRKNQAGEPKEEEAHFDRTQKANVTEQPPTIDSIDEKEKKIAETVVLPSKAVDGQEQKDTSKADPLQTKNSELEVQVDAQLSKLQSLYETYRAQAVKLFAACRGGLVESVPALDRSFPEEFPVGVDEAKARLATLIEGRSESLTALAADITPRLEGFFATVDEVTEAIKVLAKRQPLVKDHVQSILDPDAKPNVPLDVFQDECPGRFWQWSVTVVDLIPNKSTAKQRRGKIRKQVAYLHNLVAVLQTLKQLLTSSLSERNNLMAKLSRQEEKVLQYQREQAKAALEQQLKESQRLEKEKAKTAKKQVAAAKKMEAAAAKVAARKEAAAAKKEAVALARKETKAKEAEEKAKQSEQKQHKQQAQLNLQRNAMMSFFQKAASTPKKEKQPIVEKAEAPVPVIAAKIPADDFDVEQFRSEINTYKHDAVVSFRTPLYSASRNGTRQNRSVQLSVYVTVLPDNPWEARPYADLQQVTVRNRYKFLSFYEDVRPPYHGTWSKKSNAVSPRNPFKKDRVAFDYEYDSEAEWEEGDNEPGEDIENAADDEEEKDEEEADGDDDGWLAADDDLDDDPDEETKLLRQKVVHQNEKLERLQSFIAPVNSRPLIRSEKTDIHLDGMDVDEALQFLSFHTDTIVTDVDLFLDPFPPLVEEDSEPPSPVETKESSIADMQALLRFVHHNSVASKEKLIDELRSKLPAVTSSRAHAMRTLESVAEKQKHPIKGHIWEVKEDVLEQYELNDLLAEKTEDDPESAKKHVLRTLAGHIHNSTHTSKEKLVDELQTTHASILVSRAETLRHVDTLADKKKCRGGGVYWEVKSSAQRDLGLELVPAHTPEAKVTNESVPDSEGDRPLSAKKRKLDFEGDADSEE